MSVFIHDATYHFCVFLLSTFNEDLVAVVGHLHRIEADHLADGFLDGEIAEVAGHGEILQFVVDEIDGLVAGDCIQVFEHFRQWLVLVIATDGLRLDT